MTEKALKSYAEYVEAYMLDYASENCDAEIPEVEEALNNHCGTLHFWLSTDYHRNTQCSDRVTDIAAWVEDEDGNEYDLPLSKDLKYRLEDIFSDNYADWCKEQDDEREFRDYLFTNFMHP